MHIQHIYINMCVIILGSYDIVIGMDWLETHNMILNYKMKWLSLIDDLGQNRVIVGRNQGVVLIFVSSLQLHKSMRKVCKLYAIFELNKNGDMEGLENPPIVSKFSNSFPEELEGLPLEI